MKRKARSRLKAIHRVKAKVSQGFALVKQGSSVNLRIYTGRALMGRIQIGSGSLVWWGRRDKNGTRFSWPRLTRLMEAAKRRRR